MSAWHLIALIPTLIVVAGCRDRPSVREPREDREVVRQSAYNTCGPAALAMLLTSLGQETTEEEIRREIPLNSNGSSLSSLIKAAHARGVRLEPWRLRFDTLRFVRPPAILWMDGDHFVVFDSARLERAYLRDPAAGQITVPLKKLQTRWDGTAALVAATP